MKRGKAASLDGLTAEHLLNCHPVIVSILVKLFNLMLLCCYVPDSFGVGLCIPLLKHGSNVQSVDGYRGITVSPVISKIFEYSVCSKLDKYFCTSDLQFGFKKKMSCSHAIYSLRTTVDHFVNGGSTVNLCAMDLSKAFDRVNHYCLFVKLLKRGIPRQFVLLFECWYCKTFIHVRWQDAISDRVRLKSGVRQGGVLSPIFFILYVDDLILQLQSQNMGCHIRGLFLGAIMYADDLILLSASVVELQLMVSLCQVELDNIDMIINTSKTVCMRIGPKFNVQCCNITLNNNQLLWVTVLRYLGVFVQSCKIFRLSFYDARKRFYIAANSIFSKVGKDNIAVVLSLVSSFCTPLFLYGSETVYLNKTERSKLNNPCNIIYNKLFNTYNKSVLRNCQYFCGYLPFDLLHDFNVIFVFITICLS